MQKMQGLDYWLAARAAAENFLQVEAAAIAAAATEIYESLANQGVWHLYGSGHSALMVDEAFHRAGGLVPVNPMTEVNTSPLVNPAVNRLEERREGWAAGLLAKHQPRTGETIWIVSNSGINPVSVDLALAAKDLGLRVTAITCKSHSQAMASRHSSGKRLFEVADRVIDTLLPPGDALLEFSHPAGGKFRSGAASLFVGVTLIHTVETLVIEKFLARGVEPPVYKSSNLSGGDQHNQALEKAYSTRILRLRA